MGKRNRWLDEEIEWGKEVADHMGVGYGEDDYWEEAFEDDEQDAPTMAEQRRDTIFDRLQRVRVPKGAEVEEEVALNLFKQSVKAVLAVDPIIDEDTGFAEEAWREVEGKLDEIDEALRARLLTHEKIQQVFHANDELGHLKDKKARIADARSEVQKALGIDISKAGLEAARKALATLEALIKTCAEELENLVGKDGVNSACKSFGIEEDKFNDLESALGGRNVLVDALKVFSPQEIAQIGKAFGAGMTGAAKLGPLMMSFDGPTALKGTMDKLGGADKLAALVTKGKLDGADIKKICDNLGPGFVGELMGDGNNPEAAIKLQSELGGDVEAFKVLVTVAGAGAGCAYTRLRKARLHCQR